MLGDMRVLAFVPARGKSKRIPHKNIVDLAGRPLIAHTIDAALGCPYVDACLVSTEDEQIARVARDLGAWVPFLRPDELASDTAKTIDGVLDALARLNARGERFDVLCLLQPTSPLRTYDDVTGALRSFADGGCRGLVSVSEVKDHPVLMRVPREGSPGSALELQKLEYGVREKDGRLRSLDPGTSTVRSQDMTSIVRVNGAIYVNLVAELTAGTSFNDNPVGYLIDPDHAVDVDEYVDLELARALMGGSR